MRNFIILTLLAAFSTAAARAELRAGVARIEVTPETGIPMYGYAERSCPNLMAQGKHDPLNAKALVLANGEERIAIVTVDLGTFGSNRLRERVAKELNIPVLLVTASHTHAGPSFLPQKEDVPNPSEAQKAFYAQLEEKMFGIVKEASASLFPARVGVGSGSIQLGYNRLVLREDGRSRAEFDNAEHVAYGPVDPEFLVLKVEDASGAVRAVLVQYACHAVVLQPSNCKYSSDYPGAMQRAVEEAIPGAQCMFAQGGAGDINPINMGLSGREKEDFEKVDRMGGLLARQVLHVARSIEARPPAHPSIRTQASLLRFDGRWNKAETIPVGITTVLLDGDIAIAAVPGEPFHKLQTWWKENAGVRWAFFFGYTASVDERFPGYIPDVRSAAYGGYGADSETYVEPGTGEQIMLRHLINLYALRGMWLEKPGKF